MAGGMKPKTFDVHLESRLRLDIDPRVFESAMSESWQKQFWELDHDREEAERQVVEHIAYNVLVNHLSLSQIDGFADLPDEYVKILEQVTEVIG